MGFHLWKKKYTHTNKRLCRNVPSQFNQTQIDIENLSKKYLEISVPMNQPSRTPNHVTMALNGQAYQECHRAQWQRVRSTNRKGVDLTTIGSTRSSFFRVCLNHSLTNNIFHLKSPHSNLPFSFISTLKKKNQLTNNYISYGAKQPSDIKCLL